MTKRKQIQDYDVFPDHGYHKWASPPAGYKKTCIPLVFDIKHNGRHKARLVTGGHLTYKPVQLVYSGVVSLRGFTPVVFLAELNSLALWATDIRNAYLGSHISEMVYIIAGMEIRGAGRSYSGHLQGAVWLAIKA
jgi:hypothetical protein